MPVNADALKSLVTYKNALRHDVARLPSGPNTRFWIYKDVEIADGTGSKFKIPVLVLLFDIRAVESAVKGKTLLCKGKCGIDSGEVCFVPETGSLKSGDVQRAVSALIGKRVHLGDDLPDYSGFDVDKLKKLVIEKWMGDSGNALVKVVSGKRGPLTSVQGYVTSEKCIRGKTCPQLERLLGLPAGELKDGAYVMRLARFPKAGEFELRGYTNTPAGKPYDGGEFPPGSGVPQWRLTSAVPATVVKLLSPRDTY